MASKELSGFGGYGNIADAMYAMRRGCESCACVGGGRNGRGGVCTSVRLSGCLGEGVKNGERWGVYYTASCGVS